MQRFRVVFIITGLAVMVVLHVGVIIWAIFRKRPSRRVAEQAEEEGGNVAAGLSAEEVAELPCHEFKEKEGASGGGGGECSVCLEALREGDKCMALPRCGHVFHAQCVASWLSKSRRCPVCRADTAGEGTEAGSATVEVVTVD